jgi:NAD(P)-dependent dehydrogenase (short-subunit alcohol dehydrogenase family)
MAQPLAGHKAIVFGVERALGRRAAVALAEAGADVALATLTEDDTAAEFEANSVANEFWAMGRTSIVLTTDGGETAVKEAIADATVELGPLSIVVWHSPGTVARETFAQLRSDPAMIVLLEPELQPDDATSLLVWTSHLADTGLRANAVVPSMAASRLEPLLKQHHPPGDATVEGSIVYLTSDASAAVEGAIVVVEL